LSAELQAQLTAWRYEVPILITNNSSSTLTDYQVLIKINTQALISGGYMKTDGGDIRFASDCGSTVVDYYLEGYLNTDSTKLWVKIPSLAPSASIMRYMFIGNPAATSISTLSIFNGPHSSTDSVSTGSAGGVANSQRGFRFAPNVPVLVTAFGKREPQGTTRYVTLFNFNTQAIVAQFQVPGPAAQYSYLDIPAFWLSAGTQYTIQLFQGTGDGYYFGPSSQIGEHLTYFDMKYCNSCTQNTFPTSTLTNLHYGYPDFLYYVGATPVTPEPTALVGFAADTNTPAVPLNLQGIAGNQQAYLSWRKNTDMDVAKYFIYRNTSNTPGSSTLIDSTNHPDTMYTATGLTNGTPYYFWVKAVDRYCIPRLSGFSNTATVTPLNVPNPEILPKVFALYQNYPNPFNPVTDIRYDIPKESSVKIVIYDLLGREVAVLVNGIQKAGKYTAKWGSENMPSGVYIYKMTAGDYEKTMKMVLLK
jgi:hypothetical protein